MIKFKLISVSLLFLFITSCNTFSDAAKVLRNEKTNTRDEFLVNKREPLILPPDYNEIPKPNSKIKSKNDNSSKIEEILKIEKDKSPQTGSAKTVEDSILDKIGK
tara:strand:+ start:420 stop:734 length:315 start_codon:yes stop_codon:yes gene_type:complete